MYVATVASNRVRILLVVTTLAICAFLLAQGATALLAAKVKTPEADAVRPAPIEVTPSPRIDRRRDPSIILRRNIFDSALGDLSAAPMESSELPPDDVPTDEVENPCKGTLRLIGTVVLPGDLERSLAAIVGTDQKAGLHRG